MNQQRQAQYNTGKDLADPRTYHRGFRGGLPTMDDIRNSAIQRGPTGVKSDLYDQGVPWDPYRPLDSSTSAQMQALQAAQGAQSIQDAELQGLFDQILEQRRGESGARFDTLKGYYDGQATSRANRLGSIGTTIRGQFDQHDAMRGRDADRIYDAGNAAAGVAPSGMLVDNYQDRNTNVRADAAAASQRLESLGISPASYIQGAEDEFGALLADGFNSGAQFANTLEMIGNEAGQMRRERMEMGLGQAELDLGDAVAQAALMNQMRLDSEMSRINDALLVGDIDTNTAMAMLLPEIQNAQSVVAQSQNMDALAQALVTTPGALQGATGAGVLPEYMDYLTSLNSGGGQMVPDILAGFQNPGMDPGDIPQISVDDFKKNLSLEESLAAFRTTNPDFDEYMESLGAGTRSSDPDYLDYLEMAGR